MGERVGDYLHRRQLTRRNNKKEFSVDARGPGQCNIIRVRYSLFIPILVS